MPDMFVKRIIRGMLPYKREKGRVAFKKVKCHIGVPDEFKDKKFETVAKTNITKVRSLKYIKIEDICEELIKK